MDIAAFGVRCQLHIQVALEIMREWRGSSLMNQTHFCEHATYVIMRANIQLVHETGERRGGGGMHVKLVFIHNHNYEKS